MLIQLGVVGTFIGVTFLDLLYKQIQNFIEIKAEETLH